MKKVLQKCAVAMVILSVIAVMPACAAEKLTLMLDWFPNIDHLPIYVAAGQGYFAQEGIEVTVLSPSATTDALKLAASDNVDIAVSYAPQAIVGASQGLSIKVIGRLVEHPLSVLLFLKGKGIESPKDLQGKTIGYTVPGMMDVLLDAFTQMNGVTSYTPVNVGFAIVQSLVAGRVDAVMGPYKNYEVIELADKGYAVDYFELPRWGIPDYDELIFISGPRALAEKRPALSGFVRAVDRAVKAVRENPEQSLALYFAAVPDAPREMERKAFEITRPLYASRQSHDAARWQVLADFAVKYGLVERKVNAGALLWSAAP